MTEKSPTGAHNLAYILIPTRATLGYPNRFKKLRAVTQRRRQFLDFSEKLHNILDPLSGERYTTAYQFWAPQGFASPALRPSLTRQTYPLKIQKRQNT
ncbi:hypothetical protein [Paraburkholderia sp. BL9I2N2]|uniref:hypothetical protein n=1 Tax=Paraburkholderia sp. BL9I2N2 TaxID=1938809 RepID=UPI001048D537|nr:hypothetical protein [Paraburkholderia sp. BL9I2N2]TCK96516.1 hypothetical protein B0G74_3186 [Paraburkholderia sp. BL9I2N2]